jgi:hypothetical protein
MVGTYSSGDVQLDLHCAVSYGDVTTMHVGGFEGQWEFLCTGSPFPQIQSSRTFCST